MKVLDLDGEKTWVVLAKYRSFSNIPEKDGIIRVDQFQQACVMQSDGKVGAKGKYDKLTYKKLFIFLFIFSPQLTCTTMTILKGWFLPGWLTGQQRYHKKKIYNLVKEITSLSHSNLIVDWCATVSWHDEKSCVCLQGLFGREEEGAGLGDYEQWGEAKNTLQYWTDPFMRLNYRVTDIFRTEM